jgi:hypothetical protein
MPTWPRIHRPYEAEHEAEVSRSRELARLSIEVLRQSPEPDTFLGRRTHDPFPKEKEE